MTDSDKGIFEGLPVRSKVARLRELMPDIEREIARGVSHQALVDRLNETGLIVTLDTFRKTLTRWRAAQRKAAAEAPAIKPSTPVPAPAPASGTARPAQAERIEHKDETEIAETETPPETPPTSIDEILEDARNETGGFTDKYMSRRPPLPTSKRNPK